MSFLRTHWWALVLFVALSLLIEAPLIAFPFYAADRYQGINIAHFGNDEHHYLTRAKEVLEGNPLGQMYLAEGKELPDSFQSNIEQIVLFPLTIFGVKNVDVVILYNVLNFLGIVALLFLMYYLLYVLSGSRLIAAASALFAVGGYVLLENRTIVYWFITGRDLIHGGFNIYGRSNFPYMALVPFFGFLIFTYRAVFAGAFAPPKISGPAELASLKQSSVRKFSAALAPYSPLIGAGALFGFLFYDYFYAWSFALGFLGSLGLVALLLRRWHVFFIASAVGLLGLLIGSFKLYSYYSLFTSELGAQVSYAFLTLEGRGFIMSMTGLTAAALFFIYWYFRRNDPNLFFIAAIILAGWVALEQQLITGRAVQYGHYYWYFVVPLSVLVTVYMLVRLVPDRFKHYQPWLCGVIIAVALLNTAAVQYKSFFTTTEGKLREQDFAPLLQTLGKKERAVVLASPGGESQPLLITIYTDHDLYWIPAAITSAFSIDQLRSALLTYLYLNTESRRDPSTYLHKTLATAPSAYTEMYEELEGFTHKIPLDLYRKGGFPREAQEILAVRDSFIDALSREYRDRTRSRADVRDALLAQQVRYILWDQHLYPEWDLSVLEPLQVIATSSDLILYQLATSE